MPDPFIRLADDLGIGWLVFADGDAGGQEKIKGVPALLNGRDSAKHLHVLADPNVEVCLCKAGFGNVYLSHVAQQKASSVTAPATAPNYWEQVVSAAPRRGKEARAIKVVEEMVRLGKTSAPPALKGALEAVVSIAGGPRNAP
jgi:predicted ATP-dependent endonuclease of OLD family